MRLCFFLNNNKKHLNDHFNKLNRSENYPKGLEINLEEQRITG